MWKVKPWHISAKLQGAGGRCAFQGKEDIQRLVRSMEDNLALSCRLKHTGAVFVVARLAWSKVRTLHTLHTLV